MDCRNERAKVRSARLKKNGGTHTAVEWRALLAELDDEWMTGKVYLNLNL